MLFFFISVTASCMVTYHVSKDILLDSPTITLNDLEGDERKKDFFPPHKEWFSYSKKSQGAPIEGASGE